MDKLIFILEKTTVFVESGIVITFALSAFFTLKYILCVRKWENFCYLKVLYLLVSLAWIGIYANALIKIAIGHPIDVNMYGMLVVRPAILFTGITMMLAARGRYFALILKGERRCRRTHKI